MVIIEAMDFKIYLYGLEPDEREAFADRCKTSLGHLKNVAYRYKPCGESLAIDIDRESGGKVTCEELRPDVDWAHLRGTSVSVAARRKAI